MKTDVAAILLISAVPYCASVFMSGAPFRVHLFNGAALLAAFTIPNLVLVSIERRRLAWSVALILHVAATLGWFLCLPLVVLKAEPSPAVGVPLLALSLIAFVIHSSLVHSASRSLKACLAWSQNE